MTSPLDNLCGPGKSLRKEAPDAKEFAGLRRSGLKRLADAEKRANSVIFVYPDPQGAIGVLFTPIYQGVAIAVLLPLTRWLVRTLSRPA